MNSKFSLTSETISHHGVTLYRIKAKKDFGNVKKGTLGGFVEKEENLSADGNAQVFGNARVFGKIKLEFGYCFAWKAKLWNVTEVANDDSILLIEDYAPATEEKEVEEVEELTMEEVCKLLGREIKIKS